MVNENHSKARMKKPRSKFGLRWKLNLLIGIILLVTMSLFETLNLRNERQMLIDARSRHFEELAQHLSWVLTNANGQDQQSLVFNYERAINGDGQWAYRVLVLDQRGQIIAGSKPELLGTVIDVQTMLKSYDKLVGHGPAQVFVQGVTEMVASLPLVVRTDQSGAAEKSVAVLISGSLDDVRESLQTSLITHVAHFLITALAMALVTNLTLSAFVLRPIRRLLAGMRRMERGEWTRDLPVRTNDEIGKLTMGYNALGRNLETKVHSLVRAEKLASVALVAIQMNRELKKPIERIRGSADYLCRHNAFDSESAHAIGRIFDQTERILGLSEKFNRDFSVQFESEENRDEKRNGTSGKPNGGPRTTAAGTAPVAHI